MTEILINMIYGLAGVLMIICLLIWLRSFHRFGKKIEEFEKQNKLIREEHNRRFQQLQNEFDEQYDRVGKRFRN